MTGDEVWAHFNEFNMAILKKWTCVMSKELAQKAILVAITVVLSHAVQAGELPDYRYPTTFNNVDRGIREV